MTNRNIRGHEPFLLKPAGKDYLWGGQRLKDEFGKALDMTPLAETWECSTHPAGLSTVASGCFSGLTLAQVIKEHPEFLGTQVQDGLPIIIKLIDAKQDLSIQVHPNDAYAMEYEEGQRGKSELWYVLDAEPETKLIYGLQHSISKETLRQSIMEGTIEQYVRKVPVKKDDVFYIQAGTIHAIGAGALVAEIQECSNLTYRLYDYNRVDQFGKKRALHIEKAVAVSNLNQRAEPRQAMRVLRYQRGYASEVLCRCQYFEIRRVLINTERCRELVRFAADKTSFRVLLCTDGCGTFHSNENSICFFKGDCFFFPADSQMVRIHGRACLLDIKGQ